MKYLVVIGGQYATGKHEAIVTESPENLISSIMSEDLDENYSRQFELYSPIAVYSEGYKFNSKDEIESAKIKNGDALCRKMDKETKVWRVLDGKIEKL